MASLIEFTWPPDLGAVPERKPLVTVVQFGDGYEQRVSESLNRIKTSWSVMFSRPYKEIIQIDKFLTDRMGQEAFTWTDPIGGKGNYVCREWRGPVQQEPGLYVISATFEEVFES